MTLEQFWNDLQPEIKDILGVNKYEIWIQKGNEIKLNPVEFGDTWILFQTNNDYFAQHVQKHIWPELQALFLALWGQSLEFRYIQLDFQTQVPETNNSIDRPKVRMTRVITGIPEDKTFKSFVIGPCNSFAHAAACAVAETLGDPHYNPLYMYGSTGLGKTHLMHAIANEVAQFNPDITPLYITAETFINDMILHLRERKMNQFKHKYRKNCSLLLMDDIQFLSRKVQMQEELFHTFEYLKNQGHQIVFTSDVLPREIEGLMDRLRTRFESGMTVDLQPPDVETLQAIIAKKSSNINIHIPSDVSHYIATNAQGNVREVEGALNRLIGHAKLRHERINLTLAQRELGSLFQDRQFRHLDVESIIRSVSSTFNIDISQILGRSRAVRFSFPRQIVMYLLKEYTELSNKRIGHALGKRDHSTVIHGHAKIKEKLAVDPSLQQTISLLKRDLQIRD